jgi:hypothetical protein
MGLLISSGIIQGSARQLMQSALTFALLRN